MILDKRKKKRENVTFEVKQYSRVDFIQSGTNRHSVATIVQFLCDQICEGMITTKKKSNLRVCTPVRKGVLHL